MDVMSAGKTPVKPFHWLFTQIGRPATQKFLGVRLSKASRTTSGSCAIPRTATIRPYGIGETFDITHAVAKKLVEAGLERAVVAQRKR